MTNAKPTVVEAIQYLRAVAALMVVAYHSRYSVPGAANWIHFGQYGVDIFFVISGFVMAHTTREEALHTDSRLAEIGAFLLKRCLRVVPLYWIALIWTSRRELLQGNLSSDLVKDFFFLPHQNAAYPEMIAPTLLQGWTLNYELFFYGLFAIAMLFGKFRARVIIGLLMATALYGALASPFDAALNSLTWEQLYFRFYSDSIILEFGYGVFLQRLYSRWPSLSWPRSAFAAATTVGFLLLAANPAEAPRAFMVGLPASVVVWGSLYACTNWHSKTLTLLGDSSYAIYLFHWALFGALKPLVAWVGAAGVQPWAMTAMIAAHVLFAAAAGVAIHHWLERPLLAWLQRRLQISGRAQPA